jgi:Xaa-Pro aminopeptidase
MRIVLIIACVYFSVSVFAQDAVWYTYDTDLLPVSFHKNRRQELKKLLSDSSLAVFFSSPVRNKSNDVDYEYHQDPDFYYLTGITEPNCLLLIYKSRNHSQDEILFMQDRDPSRELWTGRRAGNILAGKISGIKEAYSSSSFDSMNISLNGISKVLYTRLPKGLVNDRNNAADLFDLVNTLEKKIASLTIDDFILRKKMASLREVKTTEELVLMQKAIDISCQGHSEMIKMVEPGMNEYSVEAAGEYVFRKLGAEDVGYPSICGAAENSVILHYSTNRRPLKGGELLLLDMGAEYHGYSADITRTVPVNGKFTDSQREIYNLVYDAQEAAFLKCKPGSLFTDPHSAAASVIANGLFQLGIINDTSGYKKYFMHGTSHYLGLDLHDAGNRGPLAAGTIITVEPGIYIPENSPCDPKWWDIGVRIEDDILITPGGYKNMSAALPRRAEEIERLCTEKPVFIH